LGVAGTPVLDLADDLRGPRAGLTVPGERLQGWGIIGEQGG
jgi:hypothetical protein